MINPFIGVFFTYDAGGTRRILEEYQSLMQEQLEQPWGLGHGNIERTPVNIVGSMMFFADRLNRKTPRTRPDHDNVFRTPEELLYLFDMANRER